MYTKQLLPVVAAIIIAAFSACNNTTSTKEIKDSLLAAGNTDTAKTDQLSKDSMATPVSTMTDHFKSLKMTGDFDEDYANIMVEHP